MSVVNFQKIKHIEPRFDIEGVLGKPATSIEEEIWVAVQEGKLDRFDHLRAIYNQVYGKYVKNIQDSQKRNLLYVACCNEHTNMVIRLIYLKVDPAAWTSEMGSPLIMAVRTENKIITRLLVDTNIEEHHLSSALSFASYDGHFDITKILVAAKSDFRYYLTGIAEFSKCNRVLKFLIDAKGDINNEHSNSTFTPLHNATKHCNFEGICLLLDAKASKTIVNSILGTPLEYALDVHKHDNQKIAKLKRILGSG